MRFKKKKGIQLLPYGLFCCLMLFSHPGSAKGNRVLILFTQQSPCCRNCLFMDARLISDDIIKVFFILMKIMCRFPLLH